MIRRGFLFISSLLVAGTASGQSVEPFLPAPVPVHAGVYHVAAGTFSPHSGSPRSGATYGIADPLIFNNSVPSGFFYGSVGDGRVVVDEGRVPTTTWTDLDVIQDRYRVTELEIGYATSALDASLGGPGAHVALAFYENALVCDDPAAFPAPLASFDLTRLPGSTTGVMTSYLVTLDLTGVEFCLTGDGDGTFTGDADDRFAWTFQILGESQLAAGPLIAGSPQTCAYGSGTYYELPAGCGGNGAGTGLSSADVFTRINLDGSTQCLFFGSAPFASFHLRIGSDLAGDCLGRTICTAQANSTGLTAHLQANGSVDVVDGDVELRVDSLPVVSLGYFIVSEETIFVPRPGGSLGDLFIGSFTLGRYDARVLNSGFAGSVSMTLDLAATPQPTGLASIVTGETWYWQYWYRDSNPAATSNFSDALGIAFE